MDNKSLLEWYRDAGVDEAIGDKPVNHFNLQPSLQERKADEAIQLIEKKPERTSPLIITNTSSSFLHHIPSAAIAAARQLANHCQTLAELEAAIRTFDGCALKKTATKTVFADGNPNARILIIGEAPGAQEDMQGIPFCGPSGQLLDRMLSTIGLDRSNSVYISNTVYWRPPGNRQPSQEETAICSPFVEKLIALIAPAILVCSGGTATTTLLQKDQSVSRLRGTFYPYINAYLTSPVSTLVTYHPSYLLRSPAQKRLAWQDMLTIKQRLSEL